MKKTFYTLIVTTALGTFALTTCPASAANTDAAGNISSQTSTSAETDTGFFAGIGNKVSSLFSWGDDEPEASEKETGTFQTAETQGETNASAGVGIDTNVTNTVDGAADTGASAAESAIDSSTDAGVDSSLNAGANAETEAGVGARTESAADAESEGSAATDVEADTKLNSETNMRVDTDGAAGSTLGAETTGGLRGGVNLGVE